MTLEQIKFDENKQLPPNDDDNDKSSWATLSTPTSKNGGNNLSTTARKRRRINFSPKCTEDDNKENGQTPKLSRTDKNYVVTTLAKRFEADYVNDSYDSYGSYVSNDSDDSEDEEEERERRLNLYERVLKEIKSGETDECLFGCDVKLYEFSGGTKRRWEKLGWGTIKFLRDMEEGCTYGTVRISMVHGGTRQKLISQNIENGIEVSPECSSDIFFLIVLLRKTVYIY